MNSMATAVMITATTTMLAIRCPTDVYEEYIKLLKFSSQPFSAQKLILHCKIKFVTTACQSCAYT
jgi:hypothetical protein